MDGSGSGKSASYSIPNAYQLLGSYVFTDPKGELYDRTAGYLKANGYEIKVLNLVKPQNSDGYNPLMHISSEIDVDVIANTIVKGQKAEGGSSDPFWDDICRNVIKGINILFNGNKTRRRTKLSKLCGISKSCKLQMEEVTYLQN